MTEEQAQALLKENERLREENRLLRQKIHLLVHHVFGRKSEKLAPGQLEFLLNDDALPPGQDEASAEEPAPTEARPRKRQVRKRRYPENLPVEEEIIDPEPVKANPDAYRIIGEEVSEQLDYQPGRFLRRRQVRRTWVKRQDPDAVPLTAELPPKLLERGLLAPGLLTHIVLSKYQDHLPLYRQEQIFRQRHGVHLGRNTLCRGVELVAEWLRPVADAMFNELLRGGYLQVDETPVNYLEPGRGRTATGYLWVAHAPHQDTVYHWAPGRGYEHVKNWLPDKTDFILQSDDYAVYQKLSTDRQLPAHAACWAHARRKFVQALDQGEHPVRLRWILHQIGRLYRIESRLREGKAGAALRQAVRQAEGRPILDRLFRLFDHMLFSGQYRPQSVTGKAIRYALSLREGLRVYLDYGQVEIDNNEVENAMRPAALGRKNWMFIGAEDAGWRSAVIYTILQSCKTHSVNPADYLKDVLERLPSMTNHEIPSITPRAWAQARSMTQLARAS